MSARSTTPGLQILTANRLTDGAVIYLTAIGTWATDIAKSVVAREEKAAGALLARGPRDAEAAIVVAPYLIAAVDGADVPRAASLRERIRAEGPSRPVADAVADAVSRGYP